MCGRDHEMNTIFHKFWINPDKTLSKNRDPKALHSPPFSDIFQLNESIKSYP